ncbi:LysR family transcriptional regulator [Frondihabitans peucedani]|uniref:LysR family transcriptional regulator n=1 Tax=Frondihabitans peucedani TaxID=598626 RepID=A0ABP8E4R0_9MICO
MDVAALSILRELGERGSVTAVARATHRSPSAISQQLKTLQRQLGAELVRRVGRGVELTDAGRALAASSVRIDTAIAEAETTWRAFQGGLSGRVEVALFASAAELLVPGLLDRMAAYPDVELHLVDLDVGQEEFAPRTADHDLVVGHRSDEVTSAQSAGLVVVPLLREPLDVALPLDHRLAALPTVTVADVIGEPWVGVPEGYPLDRVLRTMSLQSDVRAEVVHRTVHLPLIENLVATGHGVALLPRTSSSQRAPGRFLLKPLSDMRAGRRIEALLRPERAARGVVRLALDALVAEAGAPR